MNFEEHLPLDPSCPDNPLQDFLEDPMTAHYGMGAEMSPLIERNHRQKCERCLNYGLENLEIQEAI